ncbi:hypothetical protein B0H65DRAFT_557529 [Neurospora tetraspora]|uniref:Uncharacterized protein n=1 Tax=Neurospora tetraspora TaxID=94610 RepID=A0AAE0JIX2_9PEZI|nr:hypothetical protein B0H65DRAFT_557529 [Neurospora tetraspora]
MPHMQPGQRASAASASATQRTTPSSKPQMPFSPKIIHVQLTERDIPLSEKQLTSWKIFWDLPLGLLTHERWRQRTAYRLIKPENPLHGPWNDSTPELDLSSYETFGTKEAAKERTQAAIKILTSLGFVDVTSPGMSSISMKWGYPNRELLNRTMPGMVKGLGINWDDVGIPDVRWLGYIQW